MRAGRAPLLLAVALLAVAACGSEPAAPADDGSAGPRLVVLAPGAAEMIDALGASQQVVGVGDFVFWPPELAARPKVGAYDTPNAERVLALGGELLITAESRQAAPGLARLRELGVEVLELDTSTYEGTFEALARLGQALGREDEAAELAAGLRRRLDALRRRAAEVSPRRVLVVVGRDPLYVAGPGSHLDEMVRLAGGVNVAADALSPYQLVSLEAMLERLPEVIVDTSDNRPGAPRGRLAGPWGRWPFLPAVGQGRVYWVDPVRLVIPGPRLPEMTELMGRMIHPELFGEPAPAELGPLSTGSAGEGADDAAA